VRRTSLAQPKRVLSSKLYVVSSPLLDKPTKQNFMNMNWQ
jgi:hypothetical protein